jgi:hypothetical protein
MEVPLTYSDLFMVSPTTVSTVGGSRFGFWSKNTVKFDVNEPLMQEHFEYVEFLYKK